MRKEDWNKFILNDGSRPRSGLFLQSWNWGEFQKSVGREVRRYETNDAVAQVISHPLPGGFYGWNLYRGPIGESGIWNLESGILKTIISDLKKTKGVFLHIEPNEKFQISDLPRTSRRLVGMVRGFRFQISKNRQPENTLILDLKKHEELFLSEMHEKTRYNIRLAERHGIIVKEGAAVNDFLKLMEETTTRDKFSAHSDSYYREMLKIAPDNQLFVAYGEGKPLAGAIINFFGKTATYLHGASSNEKRNLMAPYLLHWEIIKKAKAAGYSFYDFWGVSPENEPNHAWAGITRFKKGFSAQGGSASGGGGEIVVMPAALDLPLRPIYYNIYRFFKRLRP